MGGCIGALYLEENPGVFRRAILNSPMLDIRMTRAQADIETPIMMWGNALLNHGKDKIPDFSPADTNTVSHSVNRFEFNRTEMPQMYAHRP